MMEGSESSAGGFRAATRFWVKTGQKCVSGAVIYKLLANRTYLGELKHRTDWVKSGHPPIVSESKFEQVKAILATNSRVRANQTRSQTPFLLKRLVFGSDGRALSPCHSVKKSGRQVFAQRTRQTRTAITFRNAIPRKAQAALA